MKPLRRLWRRVEWPCVAVLAVVAAWLGFRGFTHLAKLLGEPRSTWDLAYLTLQLFVLESGSVSGPVPWQLEVARFLAPLLAAYTTVRAIVLLFGDRFERLRIRLRRNHVVLCGLGRQGFPLATALRKRGLRVTVIEEDSKNETIQAARSHRIPVLVGDARSPELLRESQAQKARNVIAVTGDDGANVEIVMRARELANHKPRGGSLSCLAHVVDPRLFYDLQLQEVQRTADRHVRLDFFNVYALGARELLAKHRVVPRSDGSDLGRAHILVVGLGQFGASVVVEAARSWRDLGRQATAKLRVTVVDREADRRVEALELVHPWLESAVRVEPRQMVVESREFAEARFASASTDRADLSAAYVCIDDDSSGLKAGLVLRASLKPHIPIIVRVARGGGLASILDGPDRDHLAGLVAFPILDHVCRPDLLLAGVYEILARAIHEEGCGPTDPSQPRGKGGDRHSWERLPEDVKESMRTQAQHIGKMLQKIDCEIVRLGTADHLYDRFSFTRDELKRLANLEHERRLEEQSSHRFTLRRRAPLRTQTEDGLEHDTAFIRNLPRILTRAGYEILRRDGRAREAGGRASRYSLG